METKKISNFTLIMITITFIIVALLGLTVYKIVESSNEKKIYSMKENIKYYAKRCYLEEKCKEKLTLKELYDNKYMEQVVNPVTKEVLDANTTIELKDNEWIINLKEE